MIVHDVQLNSCPSDEIVVRLVKLSDVSELPQHKCFDLWIVNIYAIYCFLLVVIKIDIVQPNQYI